MSLPLRCLAIVLFLVSLNSCSATGKVNCEGQFYYNPDLFTQEEQGWIRESSDRWNAWVGRTITSVRPGYSDVCSIDPGSVEDIRVIGIENHRTQNIKVDVNDLKQLKIFDRNHFEGVVLHELGHALGYGHIGKPREALMSAIGGLDFTELDRIECIKHGMCLSSLPSEQER